MKVDLHWRSWVFEIVYQRLNFLRLAERKEAAVPLFARDVIEWLWRSYPLHEV
jgi:hypothetical protein